MAPIRERLDALMREPGIRDLPIEAVIRAVMTWAAEQGHAIGGYPQARLLMLDALETVLLRDTAGSAATTSAAKPSCKTAKKTPA